MKYQYYLFILSFLFISCEEDTESPNPIDVVDELNASISGYVQKGPFLSGSDLILYELDSNLNQTGKSFSTKIEDNKGTYDFGDIVLESDLVKIIADGYYYNEVLGKNSVSRLSLSHISKISDENKININILTSLSTPRIEYLMKNGMTFQEAELKSKVEILDIFNIKYSLLHPFTRLDISENSPDNEVLLAISVIVQGLRKDAEINELIQNMSTDLKEDGKINSSITMSKLLSHASFICIDQVKINLKNKYDEMGQNISLPDFEKYLIEFDKDSIYERNHLPISYPEKIDGLENLLYLDDTVFDGYYKYSLGANILGGGKLKVEIFQIENTLNQFYGYSSGTFRNFYSDDNDRESGYIDVFREINDCGDSVFVSTRYLKNTFITTENDQDFIAKINITPTWGNLRIEYFEMCSETPTISRTLFGKVDVFLDEDGDGIHTKDDFCLNTPAGALVDENGCSESEKDTDGDGVKNNLDKCPCTLPGEEVDSDGC